MYVLQGLSAFVLVTGVVAVIIGHIKLKEAQGTWLESHFRWQIRTFWLSAGGFIIGLCMIVLLLFNMIPGGFLIWSLTIASILAWTIYRVARGAICLSEGKPI